MKFLSMFRISALVAMFLAPVMVKAQTIAAGQAVTLAISGVPANEKSRIDGPYTVSQSGTMRLPFVGELRAAGLTANQLAANIEGAYKSAQIYTTPTIQILTDATGEKRMDVVTVGGYVRQPGPVKLLPGMTLYQAVQNAGGANEFGAMGRVRLMRNGKQREYDLNRAEEKNILVEKDDTIEVPQKGWTGR